MKKTITAILLLNFLFLLAACAGGGGRSGGYHYHHGYGPWSRSRDYYRDRVIVVPERDLPIEATTPSGPEMIPDTPDMGMPDIGSDFDGDMGGDW
jgi:hypothetical protein